MKSRAKLKLTYQYNNRFNESFNQRLSTDLSIVDKNEIYIFDEDYIKDYLENLFKNPEISITTLRKEWFKLKDKRRARDILVFEHFKNCARDCVNAFEKFEKWNNYQEQFLAIAEKREAEILSEKGKSND